MKYQIAMWYLEKPELARLLIEIFFYQKSEIIGYRLSQKKSQHIIKQATQKIKKRKLLKIENWIRKQVKNAKKRKKTRQSLTGNACVI